VFAGAPRPGFAWAGLFTYGTVLDPGEDLTSPRASGGHRADLRDRPPRALGARSSLGGRGARGYEWRQALEATALEGQRHLLVHGGHLTHVTERDRSLLEQAGELVGTVGWVGDRHAIRTLIAEAAAAGATEILYAPSGPDIPRELRAFARGRCRAPDGRSATGSTPSPARSRTGAVVTGLLGDEQVVELLRHLGSRPPLPPSAPTLSVPPLAR
jgi:5,10-methylenetetrahydromethanopterin reductase